MIRASHRSKAVADRLAALLNSNEGSALLRLIAQLGEPEAGDEERVEAVSQSLPSLDSTPIRVGIWESRTVNGEQVFVRARTGEPWHLWAFVQNIPPKRDNQRIAFLGESVARGYLYDPSFNPSLALQAMLRQACTPGNIEVIDLARVDLTIDHLEQLAQSSLALDPDALVVFAGNNWHPILRLHPEELYDMSAILREGDSWQAVKQYAESLLRARVVRLMKALGRLTKTTGIPVVFILPEFNLGDWRNDCDSPPFMLGGEATALWLKTRENAEHSLANQQWEMAEALGWELIEMDGGATPVGPNIIAESSRARGETAGARRFLEMARDASVCWPLPGTPRCYSTIQETIRSNAGANHIRLVDLPRRFEEYLRGDLPGRRLFLDYCHLNVEGIRVAMALTGEAVLPLLGRPERSWIDLSHANLKVTNKVVGEAHFLAAVHNSGWGQGSEIVEHHCHLAIKTHPEVTKMMQLFLDFYIRRAPSTLCRSFDEMCRLKSAVAANLLYNDSVETKYLNSDLISVLTAVLEDSGAVVTAGVYDLLKKEHAVSPAGVDLLEKRYSVPAYGGHLDNSKYAFYRAASNCSKFRLVCGDSSRVRFTLTQRVPGATPGQSVCIRLNNVCIGELTASSKWTTSDLVADASVVWRGFNRLEVQWPIPLGSDMEWKERTAAAFETGEIEDAMPVYGHIHAFRAIR
jgi:hypothetical protein